MYIDILFIDGTHLTDYAPIASDTLPLINTRGQIDQWQQMVCPADHYAAGNTTQTILIGYNNAQTTGDFGALIDDLQIFTPALLPLLRQGDAVDEPQTPDYAIFDNESF